MLVKKVAIICSCCWFILNKVSNEVYSEEVVHSWQSFEISVKKPFDRPKDYDNEEILALLLTEQAKANTTRQQIKFSRHKHVEILIGVYVRQLCNTLLEIKFLLQRLRSKQKFIALVITGYCNHMIRMKWKHCQVY